MNLLRLLGFGEKRCSRCGAAFFADTNEPFLCGKCRLPLVPYAGPKCALCGNPQSVNNSGICAKCGANAPPWSGMAYYGIYGGQLREMILEFKFEAKIAYGKVLGALLLYAASRLPKPDVITAIPQYPAQLAMRGFNQAHELGRYVSRKMRLPLEAKLLAKIKKVRPQEELSAAERQINMQGAFKANARAKGKSIWLVDDVMTTGSTCREAAGALLASGAKEVNLLILARTPLI